MTEKVLDGQISLFDLDGCFGRTFADHFQVREKTEREEISKQFLRRLSASSSREQPMFLYLQKASGQSQELLWDMEKTDALFPSVGEYMTASFGEQPSTLMEECSYSALPNGVGVSRLSQILEDSPHLKYLLSEKACLGLIKRSERVGKKLPKMLLDALLHQAHTLSKSEVEEKSILLENEPEKEP